MFNGEGELDRQYDFVNWCVYNLKIIDMRGKLIGLDLNDAQLRVHATLEIQRRAGLPVRAIILKARREGVSTYVEARFFYWLNMLANRFACVASADIDGSDKIFGMTKLFQKQMPDAIKRETEYSSRKEITFADPHRSKMLVQTAGKQVLGRGGLTHFFHCSEFAFWEDARTQFGGAAQEVPDYPDTEIIIESTANGMGNAFHDMYERAVFDWNETKDPNNYLPIFLPWYLFKEYRKKPSTGFVPDEHEELLAKRHNLDIEQIYWRRWAIKNKCQNDEELFRQEYPSSWQEAFTTSGNPVFKDETINYQSVRTIKEPKLLMFTGSCRDDINVQYVNRSLNCWQVKEFPRKNGQYTIGIDTMEGRISDASDEKSQLDYHGVSVFDRDKNEVVAIYKGRGAQHELGLQCLLAARYFNDAWVIPEIPNGMVLLQIFKNDGYSNIFSRIIHEEQFVEKDSEELGWRTTLVTRKWLVDDFITLVTDPEPILLNFADIVEEMRWFVKDKNGKPIHSSGKHDDLLFSTMLAVQGHKKCPLSLTFDKTGTSHIMTGKGINKLATIGAIDDEEDDEGNEQEYTL